VKWPWSRSNRFKQPEQDNFHGDLEWIFVDGFEGHVPSQDEISFLLSDPDMKQRKRDVGISTGGMPGSIPTTPEELYAVAGALAITKGRRKLGHDIDLDKITCQIVRDLLVVKVWR